MTPALRDINRDVQHNEPPPFFGAWRRVYVAVVIYLGALITLFYVFTRTFSS